MTRKPRPCKPVTERGKRLMEMRKRIVSSGTPLLSMDEINGDKPCKECAALKAEAKALRRRLRLAEDVCGTVAWFRSTGNMVYMYDIDKPLKAWRAARSAGRGR
jgi:hypothetical protein